MAVQEPGRGISPMELQRAGRDRQRAASSADDPAARERAIAAGLAAGRPEALEAAFRSWAGMIHGYCRKAVGDAADDLTQQVFVEAWRTRARFDADRGVVPAWLVGIARNLVARHRSGQHRTPTPVAEIGDRASDAHGESGDADQLADRLVVAAALDVLSHVQRATLRMSFFDGLSQSEIAQRLDLPLGTVKSHQRRGLQRLRTHLEQTHVVR